MGKTSSKYMSKYFFVSLLILLSGTCFSGSEPVVSYGGFTYFGDYDPKSPESLDDVPPLVRTKVEDHLISRLGKDFYSSLVFNGGQIVDYASLLEKEPNAVNYKWEVHAYDLHFKFSKPEIGLQSFIAQIKLRKDGSVLKEINLPDLVVAPEKLKFISMSDALEEAKKLGHSSHSRVEFVYLEKFDSLAWKFSRVLEDDGLVIEYEIMEVSAHTGLTLNNYKSEAIR